MQMNIILWLVLDLFIQNVLRIETTHNSSFDCLFSIIFKPAYSYLAYYLLLFHGEIIMYVISDRMLKFKRN